MDSVQELVNSSLATRTQQLYRRVWKHFDAFCGQFLTAKDANIPVAIPVLSLYLAYLHKIGYASSTISTYNSALGFFHKLHNVPDPSTSFFILSLLKGVKRKYPSQDNRLPITFPILVKLIGALDLVCTEWYFICMYKAMFLLAFYAFLRVSEMTYNPSNVGQNHCLQLSNIHFTSEGLTVRFNSFKHSIPGQISHIAVRKLETSHCPVNQLSTYLQVRGIKPGSLFINPNGLAVTRDQFVSVLNAALSQLGLCSAFYKSHSFRIGACSYAMELGKSDLQIRTLGRWNSNAFLKYIRPSFASL